MKDDGSVYVEAEGEVSWMHSGRCTNDSYFRLFSIDYGEEYRDKTGEKVYINMKQYAIGYNPVARKVKAGIGKGDYVYIVGWLKSRYTENREHEVFIYIHSPENVSLAPITDRQKARYEARERELTTLLDNQ